MRNPSGLLGTSRGHANERGESAARMLSERARRTRKSKVRRPHAFADLARSFTPCHPPRPSTPYLDFTFFKPALMNNVVSDFLRVAGVCHDRQTLLSSAASDVEEPSGAVDTAIFPLTFIF